MLLFVTLYRTNPSNTAVALFSLERTARVCGSETKIEGNKSNQINSRYVKTKFRMTSRNYITI